MDIYHQALSPVCSSEGPPLVSTPSLPIASWARRLPFPTKILASYALAGLLLLGSLSIFGAREAREQDAAEISYTEKAVKAAIEARGQNFRSWLKGYALWDDIYVHMVQATDRQWADDNLGPRVWKTFTMPMKGIFIADAANQARYRYWGSPGGPALGDFQDVDFPALRKAADRSETPVVTIVLYDAHPLFLGMARLRPMHAGLIQPGDPARYLIWLQPLSGRVLSDIGQSMTIADLRWDPRFAAADAPALDLFPHNAVKGRVTWAPRRPGTTMLRNGWLPGMALILFTALVGMGQYLLARRLNALLRQKQAEAEAEAQGSRTAAALAGKAESEARALTRRLREQEQAIERLSRERETERDQRKREARDHSLATLSLFEQDFNTVLHPISEIAGQLDQQSSDLEQQAEAGRKSAGIVLASADQSTQAIDIVVRGNQSLQEATARLDVNVSEAVASTQRAEKTIDELIRRLADISANTVAVEQVVATVAEVATRINMLALNARIEAARAGESGRGFAVVADEVRQMAELARRSTETISTVIQSMHNNTHTATSGINSIRAIVGEIAVVTGSSRSALDHQSAVAAQIMEAVASAQDRVNKTDNAIRKLDQLISSSEHMARALSGAAGELTQRSRQLHSRAGQFTALLRDESQI